MILFRLSDADGAMSFAKVGEEDLLAEDDLKSEVTTSLSVGSVVVVVVVVIAVMLLFVDVVVTVVVVAIIIIFVSIAVVVISRKVLLGEVGCNDKVGICPQFRTFSSWTIIDTCSYWSATAPTKSRNSKRLAELM